MQYPTLRRAITSIALDNGIINRHTPEAEVVGRVISRLEASFTPLELQRVNNELSKYSHTALEIACYSENTVNKKIFDPVARAVLTQVFSIL